MADSKVKSTTKTEENVNLKTENEIEIDNILADAEKERKNMTLIAKLAKIREICDYVQKDLKGYGYKYADITKILAKVSTGMKVYGVSLIPSIVQGTPSVTQNVQVKTKLDKNGTPYESTTTEMMITATMNYRWINDNNPDDFMDVPWFIVGSQDDPSQAFGAALTYCSRYFLTNYFQIAQSELDVDTYRSNQKEAEDKQNSELTKQIIESLDILVQEYTKSHPNKRSEIVTFMGRYIKGSNYLNIKNVDTAIKLLNDFKETYLKEEK